MDLSSFPTKNLIFQHSVFNISGFPKFIKFAIPIYNYTYFQKYFFFFYNLQKSLLIVALRSTINTESVPQLSWPKIWSISGIIVLVNYAMTSRWLWELRLGCRNIKNKNKIITSEPICSSIQYLHMEIIRKIAFFFICRRLLSRF